MDEKVRTIISMVLVVSIALLLAFPFAPAIASDAGHSGKKAPAGEAVVASEEEAASGKEALISEKAIESAEEAALEERALAQEELETSMETRVVQEPWEVTSLDISKDVDVVVAPGMEISLEKTASQSYIEMMVGETKEVIFTINVEALLSNSYYIAGNIFVQNTGEWPADVIAVSDTIWYKAGGPTWLAAASNITTTVPMGDDAIPTGGPHVYSYSGTFTLPVPLASVTSMSNLIEITISNKPDPPKPGMQDWKFHYRQDFAKPAEGGSTEVSLEDIETITPDTGLSYEITSATINGSDAGSLTGPWDLDLADAPFIIVIEKDLTAEEAGEYTLNNKARIGDLEDDVDVEIVVREPEEDKGNIEGYKWIDINGNGEMDNGDVPYEGLTVELWKDGALVDSTTTGGGGHFAFYNLDPGKYEVREILGEGWHAVFDAEVAVEVEENETAYVNFLNAEQARVTGEKIDFTTQEPVAGVKFVLEGADYYKEIFSAADGSFDFGWLMPGEYLLSEVVPEGWAAVSEIEREIILENGDEENFVFLNERLSAIYGYKWLDSNGDGIHQEDEPALQGVTIRLEGEGASEETITDSNGFFIFEDLKAGQYAVMEEVPDGYYATSAVEVLVPLAAGEEERVDFLNAVVVAGEVVTPPAEAEAEPEAGQTLPVTGLEMSWILMIIIMMILTGAFIASFGLVRTVRLR